MGMTNSYIDIYDVHEVFTENKYQKILLGSSKKNSEQIVIINIINKELSKTMISDSQFSKGLKNLVFLENTNDNLIIVTECKEGTSLKNYLDFFDATVRNRINLAYEYLTKTLQYDVLSNCFKTLLVDESQIIIKDSTLYFNELIILDDKSKKYQDFNSVIGVLIGVVEKIIFINNTSSPIEDALLLKISKFIEKFKDNDVNYTSLKEIHEEFRNIYIYEMYLENTNIKTNTAITEKGNDENLQVSSFIENKVTPANDSTDIPSQDHIDNDKKDKNNLKNDIENNEDSNIRDLLLGNKKDDFQEYESNNKVKNIKLKDNIVPKKLIPAIVIVFLLLAAVINLKSFIIKPAEPVAHFIKEKINSDTYHFSNDSVIHGENNELGEILWQIVKDDKIIFTSENADLTYQPKTEGKYSVILKIKDKYDRWNTYEDYIVYEKLDIDDFQSEDNKSEKLENLNADFLDRSTLKKDYSMFRNGSYSYILGNKGEISSSTLKLTDLNFRNKPLISMWLASEKIQEFEINIIGLRNGTKIFKDSSIHRFRDSNSWELFKTNDTSHNIDEIQIEFNNFLSPIWVDDIELEPFK